MKHFYIVANEKQDVGFFLSKEIRDYILQKGGTCSYSSCWNLYSEDIPSHTECVLCVGGDGTFIRTALRIVERKLPMIGVNRGHLGYLCELDSNTVFQAVDRLIKDQYTTESRMLLEGHCIKDGEELPIRLAFNDVVVHRGGQQQMVSLVLYINRQFLNHYNADGMVVASPTGSTGYSLSAGGPIVDPKSELLLLTPINPQAINAKSIVLEAQADHIPCEIVLEIGTRHRNHDEKAEVSFDGDHFQTLSVGDKIIIRQAQTSVRILKLNKMSFLEILKKKMR